MQGAPPTIETEQPSAQPDRPGIAAPAPLIAGLTLGFGYLLDQIWWIGGIGNIPRPYRVTLALLLLALGGWFLWIGIAAFRRVGTDFNPLRPSTVLATSSIYAKTRNPMYQGFVLVTLGFGVLLRSDWTVLMLIPAMLLLHYGVVLREERYLERKFGDDYRAFKRSVPRYGLPFGRDKI